MRLLRPFRRLCVTRKTLVGLCVCLTLVGCDLDRESDVRASVEDWVKIGETLYFVSRSSCTAALFDVKSTRISSVLKKVRSLEAALRAVKGVQPIAFEIAGSSPTQVTEDIMTADLPTGLGLLTAGTSAKACMADEMGNAYYNALLDPTSIMIFDPELRSVAVFDNRNKRLFYSHGRSLD